MVTKVDIEVVVLFTSAIRSRLASKASLIAYLEGRGCRNAVGLAVEALVADNPVQLPGSPAGPAAAWHTDDSSVQAGETWRTLEGPHSLSVP
jgi:hypothetical protein